LHVYPGDSIDNDVWQKSSPYYESVQNDNWGEFAAQQYTKEIAECAAAPSEINPISIEEICDKLNDLFIRSCKGISKDLVQKINFILTIKEFESRAIYVAFKLGKLTASLNVLSNIGPNLQVRTNRKNLLHSIHELWGGDVFFIGYGADIDILKPECIKDNLDIVSLRVLSLFPTAKQNLPLQPIRSLRYFFYNTTHVYLAIKQKIFSQKGANSLPFNERSHWVQISKCETCMVCNLPLLTNSLAEKIALK
jgi:hypothetical protein